MHNYVNIPHWSKVQIDQKFHLALKPLIMVQITEKTFLQESQYYSLYHATSSKRGKSVHRVIVIACLLRHSIQFETGVNMDWMDATDLTCLLKAQQMTIVFCLSCLFAVTESSKNIKLYRARPKNDVFVFIEVLSNHLTVL